MQTKEMEFLKKIYCEKGITLIALVVTIIILIILAGVSMNLLMEENGVMTKAKYAKEEFEIAKITEKLELEKGPVQLNNDGRVTLETYLTQIINREIIQENNIKETGRENSRIITVDEEYVYLVEDEKNGNVKITYQGKQMPTLTLSSNNGKVLSGNSINVTIIGTNYGILSCSSSDDNIATASINGTELTVTGTNESGTQDATITINGSKGASCQYIVTSHVHSGNEGNGSGCYTNTYTVSEKCGYTSFSSTSKPKYCGLPFTIYSTGAGAFVCARGCGGTSGVEGAICYKVIGYTYTYTCKNCGQTYSSAQTSCSKVVNKTKYSLGCGF